MRDRHLLIWGTGMELFWSIDVSFQPTRASGFREVVGSIDASRGRLLLTSYESLTMAAQFPDVTLPEAHERGQVLSVSPGLYDCRIVQLSDPESGAPFEEPVSLFERTEYRGDVDRDMFSVFQNGDAVLRMTGGVGRNKYGFNAVPSKLTNSQAVLFSPLLPSGMSVSPGEVWSISGLSGGPFAASTREYTSSSALERTSA